MKYTFMELEIKRELKKTSHLTLYFGSRICTVICIKHFIMWLKQRNLKRMLLYIYVIVGLYHLSLADSAVSHL